LEDAAQWDQMSFVILAASAHSGEWGQVAEVAQVEEMMATVEVMEAYPQEGEDQHLKGVDQMAYNWCHFALVGIWW